MISTSLKKLRQALDLTHADMGKFAGVSARTWQDYEAGVKNPRGSTFEALAKKGINTNWIFTGKGPMRLHSPDVSDQGGLTLSCYADELGIVIERLYASPVGKRLFQTDANGRLTSGTLRRLAEYAAFLYDQMDVGEDYPRQLQTLDAAIAWLERISWGHGPDSAEPMFNDMAPEARRGLSPQQVRILDLIAEAGEVELKDFSLACNFPQYPDVVGAWEMDARLPPDAVMHAEMVDLRRKLALTGFAEFKRDQPERGLIASIAKPEECVNFLEVILDMHKELLRDRVNTLLAKGLAVRPEHFTSMPTEPSEEMKQRDQKSA